MKLLVVEDEEKSASFLYNGLTEGGFVVDLAYDGEAGLHMARTGEYDLMILDLLLPKKDGWAVLKEVRTMARALPVIVLSAIGETMDRVRGLDLGADDYLAKPFAFSELLARVRSVLRRGPDRHTEVLRIGDVELDVARHRVSRAGNRMELTLKEFQLLSLLMRRSGELVTRRTISEQIWEMHFDSGTNVVDVHIRRLRAKLDDTSPNKLIHTVRGMGYMFEPKD